MLLDEEKEIDEALSDVGQAVASLTSVDGAVIMNERFDVLGFGAEVIALSPSLSHVKVMRGSEVPTSIPVESFGTRHRSAFRFCSSLEESIAFVLSQDGGVKAVKRHGKDVFMWPNINAGGMGL
jgi:DNA integrity scanning protein DisA with diadenylate cyclase activity